LSKEYVAVIVGALLIIVISYLMMLQLLSPPRHPEPYDELMIQDAYLFIEYIDNDTVNVSLYVSVKNVCDELVYLDRVYIDGILIKAYEPYSVSIKPGSIFADTIWVGVFNASDKRWVNGAVHDLSIRYEVNDRGYMAISRVKCCFKKK